jgi:uncharacterized protein YacL
MLISLLTILAATNCPPGSKTGIIDVCSLPHVTAGSDRLMIIYNTVIAMFGAVALLVLVIAGLRYVASNGDPNTMAKAKNTIIYAGIGLIVTLTAFVIVNFALNNV